MEKTLEFLLIWFLVSVRASGLLMMTPVFSGRTVPVPVRLCVALFMAYVVASHGAGKGAVLPETIGHLIVVMVQELLVGLFMGWAVRLFLHAVEIAGQLISTELGLSMGAMLDPFTGTNANAIGTLMFAFGTLVFFISGAHQNIISAFIQSFTVAPLGVLDGGKDVGTLMVISTGKIFSSALQIGAPLVALNFIISLTFSILGRAAPSTHVFSESFALRIYLGTTLLGMSFGLAAQVMTDLLKDAPEQMMRFIP